MRVSEEQVRRSLAALRAGSGEPGDGRPAEQEMDVPHRDVAPALLAVVRSAPRLRDAEVARARATLGDDVDSPTAEDVAARLIGRLVCDRLR